MGLVLELVVAVVAFNRTKDTLECGETTGCGWMEPEIWGLIFFAAAAAAIVSLLYLIVQSFRGDL